MNRRMNRKEGFLSQQLTVVLLFLTAVFLNVLVTKIVMIFTPGSTVQAEASRINKYFFGMVNIIRKCFYSFDTVINLILDGINICDCRFYLFFFVLCLPV